MYGSNVSILLFLRVIAERVVRGKELECFRRFWVLAGGEFEGELVDVNVM